MSTNLDDLTAQVLALPPEQRFELAQQLWESVEPSPDVDDELIAEFERRDAEIESGAVKPIPYEQAMRDIRDSLK